MAIIANMGWGTCMRRVGNKHAGSVGVRRVGNMHAGCVEHAGIKFQNQLYIQIPDMQTRKEG